MSGHVSKGMNVQMPENRKRTVGWGQWQGKIHYAGTITLTIEIYKEDEQ